MSLHCSSLVLVLWLLLVSPPTTQAGGSNPPSKPILTRLAKDASTSLYTITIKHGGAPLLLDLGGPLLWSRCPRGHPTIPCHNSVCRAVNQNTAANCAAANGVHEPSSTQPNCVCTAYPYNPVSGQCARADATTVPLSANATDGKNPLFPVSFMAFGSCAPEGLFASLPAGAGGVAGLSRLPQSPPTQFASILKVAKQFALCLPGGGGTGAAIFGGGPFQLLAAPPVELAAGLRQNELPFLKNPKNGAYYFRVTGISVNTEPVAFPPGAFDLDAGSGAGGVMFSTVTPYTALRSDIYRPLLKAFDAATSGIPRAPPVKPFQMCYQASALGVTRLGFAVANIEMFLDGGRSWLLPGGSSLVQVNDQTVCFAFLEMTSSPTTTVPGSPAVVFGGFQLEDHLLLFDLDKETFAFSGPLAGIRTTCSNFNFTMGSS